MDARPHPDRESLKRELQLAIRNVNRNLHEWKDKRRNTMLTISYTEIQGLIKNWIIRGLKNVLDSYSVNRMFARGNIVAMLNDDLRITNIHLSSGWRLNTSAEFNLLQEIVSELDYKSLWYDPNDYKADGISQRDDEFYYKPVEIQPFRDLLDNFKYETPKT